MNNVGSILKHVFNNAVLPKSMMKNVACQGGSRKIFGLCYTNDSKVPKRSRQLAWRATVEECKNLSKLALQVRYLIIDGVGFTNQKHLPSRVMKNVIRTKQKEGGNNNYWFPNHMYHYI